MRFRPNVRRISPYPGLLNFLAFWPTRLSSVRPSGQTRRFALLAYEPYPCVPAYCDHWPVSAPFW